MTASPSSLPPSGPSWPFVAAANLIGDHLADLVGRYHYGRFLHESIVIGAWVALWRPLEIFLYDWWPILGEARLYDRLSAMEVQVVDAPRSGTAPARPA